MLQDPKNAALCLSITNARMRNEGHPVLLELNAHMETFTTMLIEQGKALGAVRDDLQAGDLITGPAIIVEAISTVVVEPGWECEVTERNDLILTDRVGAPKRVEVGAQVDAITLDRKSVV